MSAPARTPEILRALDPDRYAAALMLPPPSRPGVQALHAFSAEVAAIRERVSSPAPGEIRLQWWRDALEGEGHGGVRSHPVAESLLEAIDRHGLPTGPLLRLLEARRFDLYGDPMPDLASFEGYAGETVSILHQYGAMVLAGDAAPEAADAAGHLGVAEALTGHLRAFGFNAARGQIFLPLSVFAAHGVAEADIFAGRPSAGLAAALAQLAETAEDHAQQAEAAIARLPRPLKPAFASIVLVRRDLRAVRRSLETPFAVPSRPAPLPRLAALIWWTLRA